MIEKTQRDISIDLERYGISRRNLMKAIGTSTLIGGLTNRAIAGQDKEVENDSYDPYPVWESAETHQVTSSDGTDLHVDEIGNPEGQAILFIHGAYQSRLAWDKQMIDDFSDKFRLAAMDLRGHGLSDKPEDANAYRADLWADDVCAVLETLDLTNPILVGWSFGGLVLLDYLSYYGDEQIAGINMVSTAASSTEDSEENREEGMFLEEIESRGEFVRSMPYKEFSPQDHYYFLGVNALAPAESIYRIIDYEEFLTSIEIPVLITHGEEDTIVSLDEERVNRMIDNFSNPQTSYYPDTGHLPFWEASNRFNRELREFARNVA